MLVSELTPEEVTQLVSEGYQLFDELTAERHLRGQVEYGAYTFLGADKNLLEEAMDEIADAGNYLRYLFAKLHILNTVLSGALSDTEVEIGPSAMKKDING
jgi:hypothetical protein